MMYDEDFVKDYSLRIFENLKLVCDRKDDKENFGYEVTQLMNSLIGLLFLPRLFDKWEGKSIKFPSERMRTIANRGNYDDDNYYCMLRHLRDAISQGKIESYPKKSIPEVMRNVEGFHFLNDENNVDIYLKIKDIYNVLMSVLCLIVGKKESLLNDAKGYAVHFRANLNIEGILENL